MGFLAKQLTNLLKYRDTFMELLLLKLVFATTLTEAVTEIVTKSQLFLPIRRFFFKRKKYRVCVLIHDLLDCGYCTSVWIGVFTSIYLYHQSFSFIILFLIGLVIHRLSNVLHFIVDRTNENHVQQ